MDQTSVKDEFLLHIIDIFCQNTIQHIEIAHLIYKICKNSSGLWNLKIKGNNMLAFILNSKLNIKGVPLENVQIVLNLNCLNLVLSTLCSLRTHFLTPTVP